jgi:hypothetical protein
MTDLSPFERSFGQGTDGDAARSRPRQARRRTAKSGPRVLHAINAGTCEPSGVLVDGGPDQKRFRAQFPYADWFAALDATECPSPANKAT